VQLTTIGDDEMERVNINKLKRCHCVNTPITIMIAVIIIYIKHKSKVRNRYPRECVKPNNLPWSNSKSKKLPWSIHKPKVQINGEIKWIEDEKSKFHQEKLRS
jgi:hypothetical protein